MQPAHILHLGQDIFSAIADGRCLEGLGAEWCRTASEVDRLSSSEALSPSLAQAAYLVSQNVLSLSNSIIKLRSTDAARLNDLTNDFNQIMLGATTNESPEPTPKPTLRTSKRSCRPSTRRPQPSRSPSPPPTTHASTTHDPRSLPLRHWFLDHLSFPYPSPQEKLSIAADCGITRAKVDSDMTNWRRRSGWTDMMVRFSGGDRDVMRAMIEMLLQGRGERVRGVGEAVEGVKRYLLGEGPKVEIGWIDDLPANGRSAPTTTPSLSNPRKRRQSSELYEIDSDSEPESESEEETYNPLPTASRGFTAQSRQMPHIPSISSLSTTSTFVNSTAGDYAPGGKRTVSGSSRYSYATDSTFADGELDQESLAKSNAIRQVSQPNATHSQQAATTLTSVFTFTPLYASSHGLTPSSFPQPQLQGKKRAADTALVSQSAKTTRFDHSHTNSSAHGNAEASSSRPHHPQTGLKGHSYISARALSPASSHASSAGESAESISSPSSVTDIEANYLPYPSFGNSGVILQSAAGTSPALTSGSGSGMGSAMGMGGGIGTEPRMGTMSSLRRGSDHSLGQHQMLGAGIGPTWSTSAPLARPDWGVSDVRYGLPVGEYEFAPRLEGRVG